MRPTEAASVLITGVGGMIGGHLAARLDQDGHEVVGTHYRPTIDLGELPERLAAVELDVRYVQHVMEVVERVSPGWIFHLAAQSYPTVSWERPQETLDTNVVGTANVFEAVRAIRRRRPDYDPVVIVASSSAIYGASLLESDGPVREDAQLLPLHPYGVSKAATDLLAYQYFKSDGIRGVRARIFNTSGPRKRGDVVSDFARRVAALPSEGGRLRVGNLSTRRAFLHVNDMVSALIALAERGQGGEAYNISGREIVSVGDLVPMFERASSKRIETWTDEALLRPTDEPVIAGDNGKITAQTGWEPRYRVEQLVADVFAYEQRKARSRNGAGSSTDASNA